MLPTPIFDCRIVMNLSLIPWCRNPFLALNILNPFTAINTRHLTAIGSSIFGFGCFLLTSCEIANPFA